MAIQQGLHTVLVTFISIVITDTCNLTRDTVEFTEALPHALSRGLRLPTEVIDTNGSKHCICDDDWDALIWKRSGYNNTTSTTPISGRSRTRLILGNYLTTEIEESSSSVRRSQWSDVFEVRRLHGVSRCCIVISSLSPDWKIRAAELE